jgi:hypothetical protein
VVPVEAAKYLFNALPQNPQDTHVHIWSHESPQEVLNKKLNPGKPVNSYDITGDTTKALHPQGANVNLQNGGNLYYQHGLDFKTKGMQDGGSLFDVKSLKSRNQKRDSVRAGLIMEC